MKKLTILLSLLFLMSCKQGLEKKYIKNSMEEDLEEISKIIPKEKFILLKSYILEQEKSYSSSNLIDETYSWILKDAETYYWQKEKQLEEQKKQLKEQKKKAKEDKKLLELRKKLLCNKNWKVLNRTYNMGVTDSINIIEESKAYRNLAYKDTWKKYFENGTYKEKKINGSLTKGNWQFISPNEIEELRLGNKTNRVAAFLASNEPDTVRTYFKIKYINDSIFAYELDSNSKINLVTIMKVKY